MKKILYIFMALILLTACQKKSFRTVYPKGNVQLTAQMLTESVQYGKDSVAFSVQIKETETPLSTLTIKVVVGTHVIYQTAVRTKDFAYENSFKCFVPFMSNMGDNEPVKVMLTATNVEGTHTDMILSSCVGRRPMIETLYLMPPTIDYKILGKGIQMQKISDNEFAAYDLNLPKSFQFLLAEVGTKFGRVDYTKPVFGKVGDEVALLSQTIIDEIAANADAANNYAMTIEDDTYQSIDTVIFNTLTFAVNYRGKIATPITSLDVQTDLEADPAYITNTAARSEYRGAKIYFAENGEFTLTGVTSVANAVNKDWMKVVSGNTVRFLGAKGMYYVSYKVAEDYLVVEPSYELTFSGDDILWVCGVGMGQPSATPKASSGWGFDSPNQNLVCRTISSGVYQFTTYLHNEDAQDEAHPGYGTVNFKFFGQHGWGEELSSLDYDVQLPIVASTEESNVGNWWCNTTPLDGIYRITLDNNKKTTTIEKVQ